MALAHGTTGVDRTWAPSTLAEPFGAGALDCATRASSTSALHERCHRTLRANPSEPQVIVATRLRSTHAKTRNTALSSKRTVEFDAHGPERVEHHAKASSDLNAILNVRNRPRRESLPAGFRRTVTAL